MKKRTTLLFACGLLIVAPVYASTIRHKSEGIFSGVLSNEKIKGKVMDKEGTPIANALVTELNDIYSNNMVQCDSTGYFEITVDTNSATLMVSAIGYLPRKLEPDEFKEKDGLKICLDVNPDFTIEGVEVVAKRKVVTVTPTGLIYNMNDNPLKSEDALEALRFVPMMIVKEDLPSVVGKGIPVVYVNNRKLRLSGQSLTAYLKSLPAQNIETVEIIRNPGARYEGADCVLDIKLKKNENNGVKGFINAKVYKIHDIEEDLHASLDYTRNKWNSYLDVFFGDRRNYYDRNYKTHYLKEDFMVDRTSLEKSKGEFGNMNFIGVYQFSDIHSLGVNANVSFNNNDGGRNGMTVYENTKQRIKSLSDREGTVLGASGNLNYQNRTKDGKRYLIADVDYLYNDYQQHVINEMNNVDELGNFQSLYLKEEQDVPQRSDIYSAKIEYGGKSDNGFSFDFGTDAYYSHIHTDNRYKNWDNNEFIFDSQHSSNFKIKEFTPALFLDLTKNWGEKFHTSLAVRIEYTRYDGKEYQQNTSFENDFIRVLPRFQAYYRISQEQGVSYSFSYNLSRPSFYDLNPFVQRISPTEYSVGNPYLQPVKIFSMELNYSLNRYISIYSQYQYRDDIQLTTQKDIGNGMLESKPENVGRHNHIGVGITGYFPYMGERGVLNMNANYGWDKMEGDAEVGKLDYAHHSGNVIIANSYLLFPKQNIRLNLYGGYRSKVKDGYARTPASLEGNVSLSTSIHDVNLNVYAQLTGYLYDGKMSGTEKCVIVNDYLEDSQFSKGRNSQIGLSISYRFGNRKVKQVQQRNTSNSGVKNRVYVNSK